MDLPVKLFAWTMIAHSFKPTFVMRIVCSSFMNCSPAVFANLFLFQGFHVSHSASRVINSATMIPEVKSSQVLRAAFWLQCAGVLLECVPEAMHDAQTQKTLHEFAQLMDFSIEQRVYHLHQVWPSRRSRWFALLLPNDLPRLPLLDLPEIRPAPVVGDLMPSHPWPLWKLEDELALQWTQIEIDAFSNPSYGPIDRSILLTQPLVTALHSWGSALSACPCGCRSSAFSPITLATKGLRGAMVRSAMWPHRPRPIHPRELQFLLGFPPMQEILIDCKGQLVLFGNAVSPIQVLWILSSTICQVFPEQNTKDPTEALSCYMRTLVQQRDVTWPQVSTGAGSCILEFQGQQTEVGFVFGQTVDQLLHAETAVQLLVNKPKLRCAGFVLPPWAFLQVRHYELCISTEANEAALFSLIAVEFLGQRQTLWVPSGLSHQVCLQWIGCSEFASLTDESGLQLDPSAVVRPWSTIVVQQDPDMVGLDLSLVEGFGFEPHLRFSTSWQCMGMYQLDQLVKSNALVSWANHGFGDLTVWLPSFAEAVVELWPSSIEPHLQEWIAGPSKSLFIVSYESWGWNIAKITIGSTEVAVTYFEPVFRTSLVVAHVAFRVFRASGCATFHESTVVDSRSFGEVGSLGRVFALLDLALGIPCRVVEALVNVRPDLNTVQPSEHDLVSPTLPWTSPDAQLPVGANLDHFTAHQPKGLNARFLLSLARAISGNKKEEVALQTRVVVLTPVSKDDDIGPCQNFAVYGNRVSLFVLVNQHWTFVQCDFEDSHLHVVQFDGLAKTTIAQLAPLVQTLKRQWGAKTSSVRSLWTFPQSRSDSCGTVALAHYAHHHGLITFLQASQFEHLHEGFAICSERSGLSGPIGFGSDTATVTASLKKILLDRGADEQAVGDRIQSAIKQFGVGTLGKTLKASNPWAALKQLGNSKAHPFQWISKFGIDIKRTKKSKDSKGTAVDASQIDTSNLTLPVGIFATNDGSALSQIPLASVQKDARGVAFASVKEALPYISEGRFISPEGLALLILGNLSEEQTKALPMHQVRIPAIYKGTGEAVLLDCVIAQLGDQAVYQQVNRQAPAVEVFPTSVFRVHIFRDTWPEEPGWQALIDKPIRSLVLQVPLLRLCKTESCDDCECYHPSIEEQGIESGLLDVWSFRWTSLAGAKTTPDRADVLSVFIRTPESTFQSLHIQSGNNGIFFEPRQPDSPGSDPTYSVIWINRISLGEALHGVKTHDLCLAACRLGHKIGVRCLHKKHKELYEEFFPNKTFTDCPVKFLYRIEPLPAGTQRQSLINMLTQINWNAKPLQAIKGSQGRAWQIGAADEPPQLAAETQHGWNNVSASTSQRNCPKRLEISNRTQTRTCASMPSSPRSLLSSTIRGSLSIGSKMAVPRFMLFSMSNMPWDKRCSSVNKRLGSTDRPSLELQMTLASATMKSPACVVRSTRLWSRTSVSKLTRSRPCWPRSLAID